MYKYLVMKTDVNKVHLCTYPVPHYYCCRLTEEEEGKKNLAALALQIAIIMYCVCVPFVDARGCWKSCNVLWVVCMSECEPEL